VSLSVLNVCGLKSKLLSPDFSDYISNYDIFACSETKLDNLDRINLEGYDFISKPRKHTTVRKSGGIGVFIRS